MIWREIVFDDPNADLDSGCDACGCAVGDEGQAFYRPNVDSATDEDANMLGELASRCKRDLTEVWVCADCREEVEETAATR
jgi:hypothetical protein